MSLSSRRRQTIAIARPVSLIAQNAQNTLEAQPLARGAAAQKGFLGMRQVELKKDADILGAAPAGADCINAVAVAHHDAPGNRGIKDAAADT